MRSPGLSLHQSAHCQHSAGSQLQNLFQINNQCRGVCQRQLKVNSEKEKDEDVEQTSFDIQTCCYIDLLSSYIGIFSNTSRLGPYKEIQNRVEIHIKGHCKFHYRAQI